MAETSGVSAPLSTDGYDGEDRSEDLVTSPFARWQVSLQDTDAPQDSARKARAADASASTGRPAPRSVSGEPAQPASTGETKDQSVGLRQKEIARRKRQKELAEASRILNGTPDPRKSGAGDVPPKAFGKRRETGGRSRHAETGSVSFLEESLPDQTDLLRRIRESEQRERQAGARGADGSWLGEGHDPGALLEAGELRLEAAPLPFEIERAEVPVRRFLSWRRAGLPALALVTGIAAVGLLVASNWRGGEIEAGPEPVDVATTSTVPSSAEVASTAPEAFVEAPTQPEMPMVSTQTAETLSPIAEGGSLIGLTGQQEELASSGSGTEAETPLAGPGTQARSEELALAVESPSQSAVPRSRPETQPGAAVETQSATRPEASPAAVADPVAATADAPSSVGVPSDTPEAVGAQSSAPVQTATLAGRLGAPGVVGTTGEPLAAATAGVVTARQTAPESGEQVVVSERIEGKEIGAAPTPSPGSDTVAEAAVSDGALTPQTVAMAAALPLRPLGVVADAGQSVRPGPGPASAVAAVAPNSTTIAVAPVVVGVSGLNRAADATLLPKEIAVAFAAPAVAAPGAAAEQPGRAALDALRPSRPLANAKVDAERIPMQVLPDPDAPVRPLARAAIVPEPGVLAGLPDAETVTGRETSLAPGVQISLFAPGSLAGGEVEAMVARLSGAGFDLSDPSRVGFSISQSNIRYYHAQDAEVAAAVAEASGALLRDFTGSGSSAPPGTIELWLAGDGGGAAVAASQPPARKAAAAKPVNRQPSAADRTARLRSQVINKLRSATSQ